MNKFYCIVRNKDDNPTTKQLLKEACSIRAIELVAIYSEDYDFSQAFVLNKGINALQGKHGC